MSEFFSPARLPVCAIAVLFLGAFLSALFGRVKIIRSVLAILAVSCSFACMIALVRPVMLGGEVIVWSADSLSSFDGAALEVDALSLFFALLVTAAAFVSCIWAVSVPKQDDSSPMGSSLFQILTGGILAFVLSGDIFTMFLMAEAASIAATSLTAVSGRGRGAMKAAFRALVLGGIETVFLLAGVAILYANARTLSIARLCTVIPGMIDNSSIKIAFALLFAGFGVNACLVPFHLLAEDRAKGSAPAAVLSNSALTLGGIYGIVRLTCFLFQTMDLSPFQFLLVMVGSASMLLCVTMALSGRDLDQILGFHAASQISCVLIAFGLHTTDGFSAGLFHALNCMLFSALLFLAAGSIMRETGKASLDELGGLGRKMPHTFGLFLIGAFSASGIPPFNGFASGWMIFRACCAKAVESGRIGFMFAAVLFFAASVLTAASFVRVSRSVFFGPLPEGYENCKESTLGMRLAMGIYAALCVLAGLLPGVAGRFLTRPGTVAAFNVEKYIDSMLGAGTASEAFGPFVAAAQNITFDQSGVWSPLAWLLILCVSFLAVSGASAFFRRSLPEAPDAPEDAGGAPLSCGGEDRVSLEEAPDPLVDLTSGCKRYFSLMERIHSGILNDAALWAAAAAALLMLFSMISL